VLNNKNNNNLNAPKAKREGLPFLLALLTGTNETFHRDGKQDEYKWPELFISVPTVLVKIR